MNCIETEQLSHYFSKEEPVLKGIDLQIPQGAIYGFLGPNGAGKTTTLRLILGLLKKQGGTIRLFNKRFEEDRTGMLSRIGSLIESPSLYAHLTAEQNLEVFRKLYRGDKKRMAVVLGQVGLSATGNKKVRQFSLGMKQRLSIAVAILHNPALLILDEPTNGLDPNGIIEMRSLLKNLNGQGMTILISSHLLHEVEKVVSHVGIISKGSLLFQGPLSALHQKQELEGTTLFETSDPVLSLEILRSEGFSGDIKEGHIILNTNEKTKIAALNARLTTADIAVYRIDRNRSDLESIFMDLTKTLPE